MFFPDADIVAVLTVIPFVERPVAVGSSVAVAVTTLALAPLVGDFGLLVDQFDNTVIMLGMLQVVFRGDPVTGSLCITSKGQIFFMDLESVSTDANIRAIAIESLVPQRNIALTAAIIVVAPAA